MPSLFGPSFQTTSSDLAYYLTGAKLAYLRALAGNNKQLFPKFAYVPSIGGPSSAGQIMTDTVMREDGTMGKAMRYRFPIVIGYDRWKVWKPGDTRPKSGPGFVEFDATLERLVTDSKEVYFYEFDRDPYGIIRAHIPIMMSRALTLWDQRVAAALVANATNKIDSLPFFSPDSAAHPYNPLKPGLGGQGNDLAVTAIDVPNVRNIISKLSSVLGPDGQPLDTAGEVKIMFLMPNRDLNIQMKQALQSAIVAQSVGVAGAGVSNPLLGEAETMLYQYLLGTEDQPVFGGNKQPRDRVFYALAVPAGDDRPIAVLPGEQPRPYITGVDPNSALNDTEGKVRFGADAFGAAVTTVWQRAIRCVLNPV